MKIWLILIFLTFGCFSPSNREVEVVDAEQDEIEETVKNRFVFKKDFIADAFDYPVGPPNAKGYYNAQKFGKNHHLGDDWNAVTGGNSDLGDPIFAIGNGYVKFAEDIGGGWGNVIRILHQLPNGKQYESLYAHCNEILVQSGTWVKRGDKIGTIGTANGQYYAHLHLEIREDVNLPIGGGYSQVTEGYLDPTLFINAHRVIE